MAFDTNVRKIRTSSTMLTDKTELLSVVKSTTINAGPKETANRKMNAYQLSKRTTSLTSSCGTLFVEKSCCSADEVANGVVI